MESPNASDHDLLITLVATVKEQHKNLSEKMDGLRGDIEHIKDVELKELKNGTHARITTLELRVNAIEKVHDEVNPKETTELVRQSAEWIRSFKVSWKVILFVVSTTSAAITFILTLLLQLSQLVKLASG